MYIILAILLLAILITIHEFGHFTAARLMKIEVREFSVGMGPRIFGRKSRNQMGCKECILLHLCNCRWCADSGSSISVHRNTEYIPSSD